MIIPYSLVQLVGAVVSGGLALAWWHAPVLARPLARTPLRRPGRIRLASGVLVGVLIVLGAEDGRYAASRAASAT